jgi:hypothetical protein
VEPGTVWTWNAIGKAPGAWSLAPNANESQKGFLLNHLISDELPANGLPANKDAGTFANADPVTGQAGWYDVRIKIYPAEAGEVTQTEPQVATLGAVPGQSNKRRSWLAYVAGQFGGNKS